MADDNRGLGGSMDPEEKHRMQSEGEKNSSQNFAKNPDLAQKAGEKGGKAAQGERTDTEEVSDTDIE